MSMVLAEIGARSCGRGVNEGSTDSRRGWRNVDKV